MAGQWKRKANQTLPTKTTNTDRRAKVLEKKRASHAQGATLFHTHDEDITMIYNIFLI